MTRGELVPDELMYGIVADRLREVDCRCGFVLDGFPRTAAQAGWLDAFLEKEVFDNFDAKADTKSEKPKKCPLIVIQLLVDYNQLLLRIAGRRSCPTCGRLYNIHSQPPLVDAVCDVDGSKLVIREDDREEVISERLATYERQTKPGSGLLPWAAAPDCDQCGSHGGRGYDADFGVIDSHCVGGC